MKKRVLLVLVVVLALAATASVVWARGGPNGTFVHFLAGSLDCETYWLKTGSGIVHQWRNDLSCAPYNGFYNLHYVLKPVDKFASPDCDIEGYLDPGVDKMTTFDASDYVDLPGDEGDLTDFLTDGASYWRCLYEWTD